MGKKKQEECPPPGAPGWMVTYGDMMTLLLTFFVLMISFATIEEVKFKAAIASIQNGLGIWPDGQGIMEQLILRDVASEAAEVEMLVDEIVEMLQMMQMQESVEVYNTTQGVRIIISDPLLFKSGEAILEPKFEKLLIEIARIIKKMSFTEIKVEGHTDNVPINTPKFPSNWELSAARALAATKFLAFKGGLEPKNLSAVGYGEYRPRDTNDTAQGRARNRRVEIYLERSPENAYF